MDGLLNKAGVWKVIRPTSTREEKVGEGKSYKYGVDIINKSYLSRPFG